jgi:hypothetical protein
MDWFPEIKVKCRIYPYLQILFELNNNVIHSLMPIDITFGAAQDGETDLRPGDFVTLRLGERIEG